MDTLDFIKINNFQTSKDIIKEVKRQPTQWEKWEKIIYLIRNLTSGVYNKLLQPNHLKKRVNGKDLVWTFLQRHTND